MVLIPITIGSKKELWNLLTPFRTNRVGRYVTDETLTKQSHEVLRLPPYYFNTILLKWHGGFVRMSIST